MWTCQNTEEKLFEFLYELLDQSEKDDFSQHCLACGACGLKLKKALGHKDLLVRATKVQFPNLKFEAPKEVSSSLAMPASFDSARLWMWSAAAILILGLGLPAGLGIFNYFYCSTIVKHHVDHLAFVKKEYILKSKAVALLQQEGMAKVRDAADEIQKQQLKVVVTGPATLQPGAPNSYQILTRDNLNRPVDAKIEAFVEDKANGGTRFPVASQITKMGQLQVVIPPDLPLRAGSQPTLIVSALRDAETKVQITEGLQLASMVFVAHIATDKPMYQPGETVYFRTMILERFSLRPPEQDFSLNFVLTSPTLEQRVVGQGGGGISKTDKPLETIKGPDGKPLKGVGAGSFLIDPNAPGGEYILTVKDQENRFPEQVRKFIVNRYQKPRINKELDFNRRSYGLGDEVVANCKAVSADGKPLADKPVLASLNLDGVQIGSDGKANNNQIRYQTDAQGKVTVKFKLPSTIEKGQASLSVVFDDGGNTETLVKPVPILLNKVNLEFFPEGGDLVLGIKSRVYFQATTPLGKPADIVASILENGKEIIPVVKTLTDEKEPGINQGLGKFELTPKKDALYELVVKNPSGIEGKFKLPLVKESGAVLRVLDEIVKPGSPVKFQVNSTFKSRLMIGVYCRGRLLDSILLEQGKTTAELNLSDPSGGVCRVTVFEEKIPNAKTRELVPVAERLFYRTPLESMRIKLIPDMAAYVPGQKVKLKIETSNELSNLIPSIIMLGVVDRTVITMADEKTARTMPTHFLLTTEIRKAQDLEYTDVLLGDHPRSSEALDLLLGSQGWRRFAEQDPNKFRQIHKEEADNLLVTIGQSSTQEKDLAMVTVDKIATDYQKKITEAQVKSDKALEVKDAAVASAEVLAAITKLNGWNQFFENLSRNLFKLVGALFLVMAAGFVINGLVFKKVGRFTFGALISVAGLALVYVQTKEALNPVVMKMAQVAGVREDAAVDSAPMMEMKMEKLMMMKDEMPNLPPVLAFKGPALAANNNLGLANDNIAGNIAGGAGDKNLAPRLGAVANLGRVQQRDLQDGENRKQMPPFFGLADRRKQNLADGIQADLAPQGFGAAQPIFNDREQLEKNARFAGPFAKMQAQRVFPPMLVREYAHERTQGERSELRTDFTETVCWKPFIITEDGKAEAIFDLSDSVTSFTATAFANTLDGRLGAAKVVIESRIPLVLQPKIPLEINAGDEIFVPLAITSNATSKKNANITLERFDGLQLLEGQPNLALELNPNETIRKLYKFKPTIVEGEISLGFKGKSQGFAEDAIRQTIKVSSSGFPIANAFSDTLEGTMVTKITMPESIIPGTLKVNARVYPSVLADLQKGLEGLLREPHGCFEQTSTTNYPNLLVLDYLRESNLSDPAVEKRALALLDNGYKKLVSFECMNNQSNTRQGYEWFGGSAPAHEALTAYGLLQFRDLTRVMNIDQAMLKRTQDYLLGQKDGKGGFKRNARALDSFGRASDDITNAYIVWALTESGKDDDVATELAALKLKAADSKDPYFLALVANSLLNRDDRPTALNLLKKMLALQKEEGFFNAESTSITGSGGVSLQIEATALVILALLKANEPQFNLPIRNAITWVSKNRSGEGAFGSTQSTILALKALIAFTKANKKTAEAGEVRLFLGDQEMAKFAFAQGASEVMELKLPEPEKNLKPGDNEIRIQVTGKNTFPATLSWSFNSIKPANINNLPLKIETSLSNLKASEGDTLQLKLNLKNNLDKGQGMAVAIVGIPAGLSLPEDFKQLKQFCLNPEDGSKPVLSAFEVLGRELVLYWRDLAPNQNIELKLDLVCRVPGNYSGQASRAYLYYNPELKHWVEPLKVAITAKE